MCLSSRWLRNSCTGSMKFLFLFHLIFGRKVNFNHQRITHFSSCCAGDVLIGTGTLSSVAASSSRVLLGGVLHSPSPQSFARMIGACCPPLFVGPLTLATLLGTGVLFHYLSCLYSSASLELSFLFVVVFPLLPLLLVVHSRCSLNCFSSDLEWSFPCPRFSIPVVHPTSSRMIG